MRILLDENIDVNFKNEFAEHDVETVKSMGWSGISNGTLLLLSVENEFEVFITLDSNLKFQQDLSKFNIHILLIKPKDSRMETLKLLTAKIKEQLTLIKNKDTGEVIEIY